MKACAHLGCRSDTDSANSNTSAPSTRPISTRRSASLRPSSVGRFRAMVRTYAAGLQSHRPMGADLCACVHGQFRATRTTSRNSVGIQGTPAKASRCSV